MKKQYVIIFLLYIIFDIYLYSQDTPRIEPLEQFVFLSGRIGDLTEDQFIQGALIASGSLSEAADSEDLRNYIYNVANQVSHIRKDYDRGEEILQLLHDSLFKNYIEDQTLVTTVMTAGAYNCVSSAVIYMAAGRAAGLDIQGVRTPDHAFASLLTGTDIVDIETTNEWGFDPGQKKEFTDSFSGSTGYNYVPPGEYSLRKDINDKQMIGLILQNRIAELQRFNNHRDSVTLAVDRYALTLSEEAKKDMYDTFSNYSSQLNGSGQYEKGINFLKDAIYRWGSSQNITKAIEALVHNYLLSLIEKGDTLEAETYLIELEKEHILTNLAIQTDKIMIYDKRTVDLLNSDVDFDTVQPFLNRVYEEGYLDKSKWINYTVYNYIKEAEIVAGDSGWLDAYLFVKSAPVDIQQMTKYIQLLNSCRGNYIVTVHNEFAELYNSGLFSEAEKAVLDGLGYLPGENTLTSDLQMIQNINSQNKH